MVIIDMYVSIAGSQSSHKFLRTWDEILSLYFWPNNPCGLSHMVNSITSHGKSECIRSSVHGTSHSVESKVKHLVIYDVIGIVS